MLLTGRVGATISLSQQNDDDKRWLKRVFLFRRHFPPLKIWTGSVGEFRTLGLEGDQPKKI